MISAIGLGFCVPLKRWFSRDLFRAFEKNFTYLSTGEKGKANEP